MVLAKIVTEAVKVAVTYGGRFARYDKLAWNKLYTGFPKYVKKGTREGFIVGSSIGGLIQGASFNNDSAEPSGNAVPQKSKARPYSKRKTRDRYGRSPYGRKHKRCPPECYRRK